MKKEKSDQNAVAELTREGLYKENKWLWEENKKLKEENEYRKSIVDIIPEGEGNVAEETIKDLQDRIKELKEEIRFLEECLDNKEKVNKKLKEELKWWKDLVHKAKEFEYDEDGMDYIWQNTKI